MNTWHQLFMNYRQTSRNNKIVTHQVSNFEHVTDMLAVVAAVPGVPLYQATPSDTKRYQAPGTSFCSSVAFLIFVEAGRRVEQCRQHLSQLHTT